jgi:two-component sensor histidine kinase
VKRLLNSGILRQNPVQGTVLFALVYFSISYVLDWLFRWAIAQNPMPPLWAILLSIGGATAISSIAVYLLLVFTQRQQQALEELNHEIRNALQILAYAARQCDAETAPKAQEAIASMSSTLRRITQRLGAASEREIRPVNNKNNQLMNNTRPPETPTTSS